jgi:hypothetical protein
LAAAADRIATIGRIHRRLHSYKPLHSSNISRTLVVISP